MNIAIDLEYSDVSLARAVVLSEIGESVRGGLDEASQAVESQARTTHDYVDRSGALTRSIEGHPATGNFFGGTLETEVGADAAHAQPIEFGARPHVIRARNKKFLRFRGAGGRFRFARSVNHPGNRGRFFLATALELAHDRVEDMVFDGALDAFRRAGFVIER